MRLTGRSLFRPAHLHFLISARGCKTLVTHLFVKGDPHQAEDAVFGVKDSLIAEFKPNGGGNGKGYTLNYDFVLSRS